MVILTEEQQKVHDYIMDWVKSGNKLLTMGGLAGVGKSTLIGVLSRTLKAQGKRIAFCTISGKASTVLKSKLGHILTNLDYCGTIHSLMYRLIDKEVLRNGRTELYFSHSKAALDSLYDLIIVDESSMINEYIFRDMTSHKIPILAVGDHGQLPAIKGNFNLMENPNIKLETIMRQEEGNPIIQMAMMARNEGVVKFGDYGQGCIKTRDIKVLHDHAYTDYNSLMLCALNKTRIRMNSFAREISKINDPSLEFNTPVIGEPLICLYNNHKMGVFNGNIGVLNVIKEENIFDENLNDVIPSYYVEIQFPEFLYANNISKAQFGKEYTTVDNKRADLDYFDWAYCLSVWKSQGSEWDNVLLIEEGEYMLKEKWPKFLYTAITRAKKRIIIYKR